MFCLLIYYRGYLGSDQYGSAVFGVAVCKKFNWLGLISSALAMFLQAAIDSSRLTFSACVRVTIALRFFTAASARPLDSGLCVDANLFCFS